VADEQIVTSIVAKADLSNLVSEVHRVTSSLQKLQRELLASNKSIAAATKVANNAFRDTLTQSGLFSSHFVNLNSDVDKFGKNLDGGRLKLRDYFSTFQQHAKTSKGLIRELAREQVMLQNAVLQPLGRNAQGLMQFNVAVPRGLDLVKNKSQLARMELQIMNRALLEGSTQLINWGKNTQWAGRQLTVGLTVPLAMFGTSAAKAFREADQELTRLVKVYGDLAGSSSQQLDKIRKDVTETAKELSQTMGVSFKDTLALAADIAATGKTGNDLLASVKETTRLAVLGEVDRQEAMKATLAIQTAFKSNTEELTESINFLNAVENQTSTTLNDLVEAIPKAGTVVKQLGGSVEDLALYLTAMREGGVNASEAANALKSGLASMINPTKQTVAVMSDFGIDIMGLVAQNTGNTTGMILGLQKALDGLDPLSKARALEQMFGKFQFARMAALFNNLGKEGSQTLQVMNLMNASASELAAVAGRELTLVTESASGKFKRAVESLKASLAGVGDEFLNFGTKILNIFEKIVNFVSGLPDPIKKFIAGFGAITAIAGPLIMITGVLANFFGYITKGIVLMKSFFQGTKGWKMLTPEMIAAEKAANLVEKAFYSDAAAAGVLHTALQKLITDYASLERAMINGVVPVSPGVTPSVTTTGGRLIVAGGIREVDPTNPLVGDMDTRSMSHINPRDPNNPASIFGGVPGATPVNQKIGRHPQIYMMDRLPNIEGVTSIKGVSTGIVAPEAAKFHALMATLGMQTEAEVAALKKTISLGGTVSTDLLQTFDDILPITQKFTQQAATQSSLIVDDLMAAKITTEQAITRIMALNAEIDMMMRAEVSAFAASRGRTIDFTKAPLMDQPVVDASGQFTLRDLYKKESNKAVMEEFGRLRGIRTYGAPYSIQTTRLPRFNTGGGIESFGPGKTVVSGDTSINYDDRLGSIPVGGYVLNQEAAQNPDYADIVAMAPYTYEDGGKITAALTPGEIVFGPKISKMPELYAIVDAANNGYNLGGQIMRGIGNYGNWDDYKSRAAIANRYDVSADWTEEAKFRMKINAASALVSIGVNPKDAVKMAHEDVENAYRLSTSKTSGRVNRAKFKKEALRIVKERQAKLNKLGLSKSLIGVGAGTMNLHASQVDAGSISLLRELANDPDVASKLKSGEIDRIYSSVFGLDTDRLNAANEKELLNLLRDKTKNKFASEHMSPRDIAGKTSSSGSWGFSARGNYLQAMAGESDINWLHSQLGETRNRKLWGNFVAFDNPHAKSLVDWATKTSGVGSMDELRKSISRGAVGNRSFLEFLSLLNNPRFNLMPRTSFVDTRLNEGGLIPGGSIVRGRMGYGNPMSLLSPEKMLRVLEWAKLLSSKKSLGSFADSPTANYSHMIAPSTGKSFPIPGVSGLYKNDKGELVFFKGVPNEISAKAEMYGTRISREVFGLDSPEQIIRTIKNPLDPTGQSKLLGLESPFDPKFAAGGTKFTPDQMIRQTIASLLFGNKDLSKSNVFGNVLADVGPAGVFSRASMNTSHATNMHSMEQQALINLLAVRGGARKDFAHNTKDVAASMTSRQYGSKMKSAMKKMRPKLLKFIDSLPESDRAPYLAMLGRLDEGMNVNWSKYHSTHSVPKYNRGGGVVRRGRRNYGPKNPNAATWQGNPGSWRETPKQSPYYVAPIDTQPTADQVIVAPNPGMAKPMGMGAMMGASVVGGMGGMMIGGQLGGTFGAIAGSILGELAAYQALSKIGLASKEAAEKGSLAKRAFQWMWRLPGPIKIGAAIIGIGLAIKKVNDMINEHRRIIDQGFAPTQDTVDKLNLKFTSLNDTLKAAKDRMTAIKESGGALFSSYTSAGVPGLTVSIKELKELQAKVKQEFPDLIKMFDKASGAEVSAKAEQLKAQFVAGGMSAQEATNIIYALISQSNKATYAVKAIASEGFRAIKDEATAASSALNTFFNLLNNGNIDQLSESLDTLFNALSNAEQKIIGLKVNQWGIVDAAEAFQIQLEKINKSQAGSAELTNEQLINLKNQNPILASILGKNENLASVYAKIRLYTMGVSMDLSNLDPAKAQNIAVAFMKLDTLFRTDTASNPFQALVKQINEESKKTAVINEKVIKTYEDRKEALEEEIEKHQKIIDSIREEADERRKALEREQQDEDVLLQIKKKQLEYNNAMAAGDMQTAAQAQLDIQRLVGQQQLELAKRAIDDKEKEDVSAEEAQIESLRNRIKGLEKDLDNLQETSDAATKNVQAMQDMLNKAIQAFMMKEGGYDQIERSIVEETIRQMKASQDPVIKSLAPILQAELDGTTNTFENSLKNIFDVMNVKQDEMIRLLAIIAGVKANTGTATGTDGKQTVVPVAGPAGKDDPVTTSVPQGRNGDRQSLGVTSEGKQIYTEPASKFINNARSLNPGDVVKGHMFVDETGKPVKADVIIYSKEDVAGVNRVFYYKKYLGGNFNGLIQGPGSGTSDSIPGYVMGSNGGISPIRVSNEEYITRASSVADIGVSNMDLINQKGTDGLIQAAQNVLGFANGGYFNRYAQGSKGGIKAPSYNFNKLEDRMSYSMQKLISAGLTKEAAAGIVGNLIAESTLNPRSNETPHRHPKTGKLFWAGRGIAQWGADARWKNYLAWLKRNGRKDVYSLENQIDFLIYEMPSQGTTIKAMNKTNSIADATKLFMLKYERPHKDYYRLNTRNFWAYRAYKIATGKDYIDVVGSKYSGPDEARSNYSNLVSSPDFVDKQNLNMNTLIPMKVAGITKLSALGFKEGGSLNPLINNRKPGVPYTRSGRPIGSPHGRYWGELERLYQQSPIGFDKYGKPIFNNDGKDPWGGTEIPGLKFTGNIPQFSDYWHQMAEQPKKPYGGPGLGLDKSPERYAGSGASMGGIGNGAYGLGPLMFNQGGYLGFKDGGAPHEKGMRNQVPAKKLNWFQKYVNSLTKSQDEAQSLLNSSKFTSWMSADPLGLKSLLRKVAGQGRKGDTLSAALFPLNFAGTGALAKLGVTAATGSTAISSTKASTTIMRNLRKAMVESAISSGRAVPSISSTDSLKLSTSMFDESSDIGAAFRKYWGKAYDILVSSKNPVVEGMSKDDFFKSIVGNAENATSRWKGEAFDFSGPSASQIDKPSDFIKAANAAYLQAHGLSASQPLAMFRAVRAPWNYDNYVSGMMMSDPSLTPEQIFSTNIAHELGGYWSLNSRMAASYLRNLGLTRTNLAGKQYGGLYRADIPAEAFPTPIGMGGMMEEYANVFNPATIDSLRSATRIGLGWNGQGGPQRYLRMYDFYKTALMPSKGKVSPEAVERLKSVLSENEIRALMQIMKDSDSGRSIKLSSPLMTAMPGHSKYNLEHGGTTLWLDIIKRAEEALGQSLLIPKMAKGGYAGQIRKFHDWNGPIPGAYGSEVSAILQAGREGVYDTDYVNALRNGTMNTTSTNNKNINIGSVQMTFTEPVKNGRQVFEEFKSLMSFEKSASNSNISLGVGA